MEKNLARLCAVGVSAWLLALGTAQATVDESPAARAVAESLKKDAVCTRCHDESETKPLLSIYQTRHGVKADSRTPTCQSCHGESDKHLAGGILGWKAAGLPTRAGG